MNIDRRAFIGGGALLEAGGLRAIRMRIPDRKTFTDRKNREEKK